MSLLKERDIAAFCSGMFAAFLLGVLALSLALGMAGCAATRPVTTTELPIRAPNRALVQRLDSAALAGWLPADVSGLPAYLVPPPPGSTPRQRRQWQKAQAQNLARAGVLPAKIKNSSVATAPGATAINRNTSPVATQGSTATDARKAGQRNGASAVGPGAVATSTHGGVSWYWYLVAGLAGAVGWEVLTTKMTPLRALLRWRLD